MYFLINLLNEFNFEIISLTKIVIFVFARHKITCQLISQRKLRLLQNNSRLPVHPREMFQNKVFGNVSPRRNWTEIDDLYMPVRTTRIPIQILKEIIY
jgi:predicted membrane protein